MRRTMEVPCGSHLRHVDPAVDEEARHQLWIIADLAATTGPTQVARALALGLSHLRRVLHAVQIDLAPGGRPIDLAGKAEHVVDGRSQRGVAARAEHVRFKGVEVRLVRARPICSVSTR